MRLRWDRVAVAVGLALFWGAVVFGLSGCAGDDARPATQIQVVHDKVIVPVPCVSDADIPAEPPHVASQLTNQAGHDLLIVDQSALDLRTWGETEHAQLKACAVPKTTLAPVATQSPPATP